MKTPISYYGGKQKMLDIILPLIPPHRIYCEPFFGGGAVFFAKKPSPVEFINDIDDRVITFYNVVANKFDELKQMIDGSLHSESTHKWTKEIIKDKSGKFTDVERAFAFFYQTNCSYNKTISRGFSFSLDRNKSKYYSTKKDLINKELKERLSNVTILCRDALKAIKGCDSEETFHFIDPPYVSANMGHYDFYTKDDFLKLLETLKDIKGKFLLTTYDEPELAELSKQMGWLQTKYEMNLNAKSKKGAKKVEVITTNYNNPVPSQLNLNI